MALRLNGATSGYVEIDAPATAGSNTLVLPNGNGSSGEFLQTDGNGGLTWATPVDETSNITYSTAQSTTSGTSPIEFTDVPTGVKKITIIFDDVGTATASDIVNVQLSTSASYVTTGYVSTSIRTQNGAVSVSQILTNGFIIGQLDNTSKALTGHAVLHNVSGNRWILSGVCSSTEPGDQNRAWNFSGFLDLGGTIDKLQILGDDVVTNNWDTGQINVMYEV